MLQLVPLVIALIGCGSPETVPSADAKPDPVAAGPVNQNAPLPTAPKPDLSSCPGMDIRRPAGTNCYGILPSVCGADKAAAFIGQRADATVRKRVIGAVISRDIRWIKPGEAMIENFSPERLNIFLNDNGRIASTDCF